MIISREKTEICTQEKHEENEIITSQNKEDSEINEIAKMNLENDLNKEEKRMK